jgi:hypothetical protein
VKRLIGRKFTDAEVQKDIDMVPYKIVGRQRRRLGRPATARRWRRRRSRRAC